MSGIVSRIHCCCQSRLWANGPSRKGAPGFAGDGGTGHVQGWVQRVELWHHTWLKILDITCRLVEFRVFLLFHQAF